MPPYLRAILYYAEWRIGIARAVAKQKFYSKLPSVAIPRSTLSSG
jgi:hypothetical protein